jgi:tetratricopeptide (TPR) repeat protein
MDWLKPILDKILEPRHVATTAIVCVAAWATVVVGGALFGTAHAGLCWTAFVVGTVVIGLVVWMAHALLTLHATTLQQDTPDDKPSPAGPPTPTPPPMETVEDATGATAAASAPAQQQALNMAREARQMDRAGMLAEAMETHREALNIFHELGDKEGIARQSSNLAALILRVNGPLQAAQKLLENARDIYQETPNVEGKANTYGNLGIVYSQQGNMGAAMEAYRTAIRLQRPARDTEGLVNNYGNLGIAYVRAGNMHRAAIHYRKALETAKRLRSDVLIAKSQALLDSLPAYTRENTPDTSADDAHNLRAEIASYIRDNLPRVVVDTVSERRDGGIRVYMENELPPRTEVKYERTLSELFDVAVDLYTVKAREKADGDPTPTMQ